MFIFYISLNLYAKNNKPEYTVSLIADSLKKGASAVIRIDDEKVEIQSLSKVLITIHKTITILKESGMQKGWEAVHYNNNTKIIDLNAKMYNALGIELDKWNKTDWKDQGYDSYGTAYSDLRRKICTPRNNQYPYTIEYNYSYEVNNTYAIEGWYPQWENKLAIENSSYELVYNPSLEIKYKEYNFPNDISKKESENKIKWEIKNMQARHSEPFQPSIFEYAPYLRVGLKHFKYENYEGCSDTWNDLGKFYLLLNKDRNTLPEEKVAEVHAIIDTCKDELSKVESLYKYMQSHTRYVNISIGIGGIQTFSAETVSKNGYGDCKALSNYMTTLLKYADIKSYMALVKAGSNNYIFDPDFVCHQGNHVIVCVPLVPDTIWLECTSQTMPCGFLGDFTDNRSVLLITENGGVLSKTPQYTINDNKTIRTADVTIKETGNCTALIRSKYTGLEYDNKHHLSTEDKDSQLKLLYKDFDIANFKINSFNVKSSYGPHPSLQEDLNLDLTKYASMSGSRLFIPLNLASKWNYIPKKITKRKYDIYKNMASLHIDTVCYTLPNGYKTEALPPKIEVNTKYGLYTMDSRLVDNKIIYTRLLEINNGTFPAKEYDDFVNFFTQIHKNDNAMAVLKKEE